MDIFHGVRHDYEAVSGSVDTTNWVEIVDELPDSSVGMEIFDSSGQTLELGIGPEGSEERVLYITPGGNGRVDEKIRFRSRLSIRAVSADAENGELTINFYR